MSGQNMDNITLSYRKNLLKEIDDLLGEQLTDFVVNNPQWLQQITDVCCATYYRALLSNNDEIHQIDEYFSGRFDTLKTLLKLTDQKITQDSHSLFSYIFINNKCRDYKYNCGFTLRAEKGYEDDYIRTYTPAPMFIGNKIVQQKTQYHLKQSKYYWTFNETVVLKEPIKLITMDTYIKQRVDPMPLPSTNIFEINTEKTTTGKICSKCNHKIMERPLLNSTFIGCLC